MYHYYFPLIVIHVIIIVTSYGVNGLSSKLDFGNASPNSGSLIKSPHTNTLSKYKSFEPIQVDTKPKETSIICTSSGCNSTKPKNNEELLNADIVVHVKTSTVDLKNTTKKLENIPDVPVVLGTNGIGSQHIQRGLHYEPIHPIPRSPSGSALVVTNIEEAFPSLSSKHLQKQPEYEYKIKTLPPVMVSMPSYVYQTDRGVELKIPYFEQTFHTHYYGENSPPQFVSYNKNRKNSNHNPVAFTNVAKPHPLQYGRNYHHHPVFTPNIHRHDPNCKCVENPARVSGLHDNYWYPGGGEVKTSKYGTPISDAGAQINDKLAPLNED